jgi:predicted secreted protein
MGSSNITLFAQWTVNDQVPTIIAHPQNTAVSAGEQTSFTVEYTGNPAPKIQWQLRTNQRKKWSNIYGANSDTYTTPATTCKMDGYQYRVILSNYLGSVTSEVAALTVNAASTAPKVTTHPSNQTVKEGKKARFSAAAAGTPTPTVQWQLSSDSGSTWSDIGGAISTTYTTAAATLSMDGYQYRAVFTNKAGTATTRAAALTVNLGMYTPTIIAHPQNTAVSAGEQASFTVEYNGNPAPKIQWQLSTNKGKKWSNIAGANSDTYTTPATISKMNGYQYRVMLSNYLGSIISEVAALTVTHPSNQTINGGQMKRRSYRNSDTYRPIAVKHRQQVFLE